MTVRNLKIHDFSKGSLSVCRIPECVETFLQCYDGTRLLINRLNIKTETSTVKLLFDKSPNLPHNSVGPLPQLLSDFKLTYNVSFNLF